MSTTELHKCAPESSGRAENIDGYGEAVATCSERVDGSLWVYNSEYGSRVNFCPFCGFEAKAKVSA